MLIYEIMRELIPFCSEVIKPEVCPRKDDYISTQLGEQACAACITQMQEAYDESRFDQLTGLYTRRAFVKQFEDLRNENEPIALYFIDIDNFKKYNELYGQKGGDIVLSATGLTFQRILRTDDVLHRPGPRDENAGSASRHGGDEIIIMAQLGENNTEVEANRRKNESEATYLNEGFQSRVITKFNEVFPTVLDEIQNEVPSGKRIKTLVEFHINSVVSLPGDTRSLDELIHEAEPDKGVRRKEAPWYLPLVKSALAVEKIASDVIENQRTREARDWYNSRT